MVKLLPSLLGCRGFKKLGQLCCVSLRSLRATGCGDKGDFICLGVGIAGFDAVKSIAGVEAACFLRRVKGAAGVVLELLCPGVHNPVQKT